MELKKKKICCKLICNLFVVGLGIGLVVFGSLALNNDLLEGAFNCYLKERFALRPHSEALYDWASTFKNGLTQNYYVFNVTNADDVIKYGALPEMKKIGPYTYRVNRQRENVYFNVETREETLQYTQTDHHEFKPADGRDQFGHEYGQQIRSTPYGTESDPIYTINLPMLTLVKELQKIQDTQKLYIDFHENNGMQLDNGNDNRDPDGNNNLNENNNMNDIDDINVNNHWDFNIFKDDDWQDLKFRTLQTTRGYDFWRRFTTSGYDPLRPRSTTDDRIIWPMPTPARNKAIPHDVLDLLKKEHILTKVTVDDLLWGWKSDALEYAKNVIEKQFNVTIVNSSTHGLLYQEDQGRKTRRFDYSLNTGKEGVQNLATINSFNKQEFEKYGYIRDGTVFRPMDYWGSYGGEVSLFIPDFCTYYLHYDSERSDSGYYPVENYDFLLTYKLKEYASNWNAENCQDNRPINISFPTRSDELSAYEFRRRAPDYFYGVKTNDDNYIVMDRYTGKLFSYQQKFQYNADVKHSALFPETMKLASDRPFPIAVKEESFKLKGNDDYNLNNWEAAERIQKQSKEVKILQIAAYIGIPYGCIVLGSLILFLFCVRTLCNICKCCKNNCKDIKTENYCRLRTVAENVSTGCGKLRSAGKQFIVVLKKKDQSSSGNDDVTLLVDNAEETSTQEAEILNA